MSDRHLNRLVGFLAKGAAMREAATADGQVLLDAGDRGAIKVPLATLTEACSRQIVRLDGRSATLTAIGTACRARWASQDGDRFQAQHRDLAPRAVDVAGVRETVTVNSRESPLAGLALRKDRSGQSFLTSAEVEAGERLRADYEFGQIAPRLGVNWGAAAAGSTRSAGNAKAELSDQALAARQRVDAALGAVGPELAGVLIDVCCFLKGLEQVEMERTWPRRSAKLMLKTALGALTRHYAPPPTRPRRGVLHWGAGDYRPSI